MDVPHGDDWVRVHLDGTLLEGTKFDSARDPDAPFGEGVFVSKASLNKDLPSDNTEHDPKIGMQIKEALQLQLDVQRRLHEQLEVRTSLMLQFTNQRLPDSCGGLRIAEALRLQLDVQRCLHEQLETQRNLRMRIEAQSRMLQQMFEEKVKTNKSTVEPENLAILFSNSPESLKDAQFLCSPDGSQNPFPIED